MSAPLRRRDGCVVRASMRSTRAHVQRVGSEKNARARTPVSRATATRCRCAVLLAKRQERKKANARCTLACETYERNRVAREIGASEGRRVADRPKVQRVAVTVGSGAVVLAERRGRKNGCHDHLSEIGWQLVDKLNLFSYCRESKL